jgi:tetratricopeptide (TPR) repeat protein
MCLGIDICVSCRVTEILSLSPFQSYRPLTTLTFKLNVLFTQYDPMYFHLVNVALNAFNTVLVVLVSKMVVEQGGSPHSAWTSLVAGLIFALHPVHVEAVANLVGRAELLACIFMLLALMCYHRAAVSTSTRFSVSGWGYLLLSWAFSVCALLSKETGITILAINVAYDILVVNKVHSKVFKWCGLMASGELSHGDSWQKPLLTRCACTTLVTLLLAYIRVKHNGESTVRNWEILENYIINEPSFLVRSLTIGRTHIKYMELLVFPMYLSYDWSYNVIPVVTSILSPSGILVVSFYLVSISCLVWAALSSNVVSIFSAAFGILSFLPASHVLFPIGATVAERLVYIPSIGYCILLASWVAPYMHSLHTNRSRRRGVQFATMTGILIILSGLCSYRIVSRNVVWESELDLFRSASEVVPDSYRNKLNYGFMLSRLAGANNEAAEKEQMLKDAIHVLEECVQGVPRVPDAYRNLASAYFALKRYDDTIRYLDQALLLLPDNAPIKSAKGFAMMQNYIHHHSMELLPETAENREEVIRYIGEAYNLLVEVKDQLSTRDTNYGYTLRGIGDYCFIMKQYECAIQFYGEAVESQRNLLTWEAKFTDLDSVLNQLGLAYKEGRGFDACIPFYESYVQLFPSSIPLLVNLAGAYMSNFVVVGNATVLDRAKELYEKALSLEPNHAAVLFNYGICLKLRGDLVSAAALMRRAIEADPGNQYFKDYLQRMVGQDVRQM